jgi:putative spermidine/putrescine transport system ATP-binding protein
MSRLELQDLTKRYGDSLAVSGVSLTIEEGEFVVLLGPSGCGKTTTLRMVAGFADVTEGRILLGRRDITSTPPWRRNTGLVFQGYALFPHLTAAENVAFGLEMRGLAKDELHGKVGEALRMVRLEGFAGRYPRQLSGGQQQRVALARSLVIRPELMLLDEPLSNLDAKLRQEVRVEIRDLQHGLGLTTVMVTHDQEEAMTMADRLVVMEGGVVQQIGTQQELYDRPRNRFVAGFVGRTSFLEGRLERPGLFRTRGGLALRCAGAEATEPQRELVLALRPERVAIAGESAPAADNDVPGQVAFRSYMGAYTEYHVRLTDDDELVTVHAANLAGGNEQGFPVGATVRVQWAADAARLLAD